MNVEKFININWYLERKPYRNHSSYDIFYLRICRDLFTIIDRILSDYGHVIDLNKEDARELAYIFTGYFEDQVNKIGFWNALISLHKAHFGKRLPFFDKKFLEEQEEQYEDILPEDIQYLAYISYLNLITVKDVKPIVLFNSPFLVQVKDAVFDYLEGIEEVLTTDFYEDYLVPEADYIEFKRQLDWFTFNSYLTSTEFERRIAEQMQELIDAKTDQSHLQPLFYTERDRLMCEVPSSFTAFFPADILAAAMRCTDKKKEEIRNLKWRPHGIFHVQGETPIHYRFLHTSTGEEFDVLKNSFNLPLNKALQEYWITTLVGWNNDFYISGFCRQSPYQGEKIYEVNLKRQQSFQKHFKAYRKEVFENALKFREEAERFFGNDFVVFETGYQLQEKLYEFNKWYFNLLANKSNSAAESKPVKFDLPRELLNAKGVALFIPPQDGFQFITKHQQLLHVLETPEADKLTKQEVGEIMNLLSDDSVGIDYWFYIKKHFPVHNLSLFMKCPLENDEDFEALLRIYVPEDFSPLKLPRFSTFSSERVSAEKAREIFKRKE